MSARAVPFAARSVADDWCRLHHEDHAVGFDPSALDGLPEVARRLLLHVLAPGVRLSRSVELTMRGQIRLGAWRPFTARQILAPREGFIWAATARVAGLPVTGFDRYTHGEGQMRWRLLGLIPVMSADGPDITRSAAGRLAAEAVLCPTAFADCRWQNVGPNRVAASWAIDGREETIELYVDADGRLLRVEMQRWGNPDGAPFAAYPFAVDVLEETVFDGVRLPSQFRAGWGGGSDRQEGGEFFRATVVRATFG
jgi:uncharacterized protein DUF6544